MDGKIDIKALVQKLLSRWHYFLLTGMVVVPLAYTYVRFADPAYLIRASLLLNSDVKNGVQSEKFLKGMELLAPQTDIEDEIGILQSYNLVASVVQKLDFGIAYFEMRHFKTRERYGDFPFTVELDSTVSQMVDVPIYITRTSEKTYSVQAFSEEASTFDYSSGKPGGKVYSVDIHSNHFVGDPFESENLKFRIIFHDAYKPSQREDRLFFKLRDLTSVAEDYQQRVEVKPISRESNIVEIILKGEVPRKEILFLNTLMDVYLVNELRKRNQLGLKTIEFIDQQLSGVSDELQQVESSLESFRLKNNILDLDATAENLARNLDRLEVDKSKLQSRLKYYKYIAQSLEAGGDLTNVEVPSTFGLEDPLLNNLILELSKLNQERTGLKYNTREGNPVSDVLDLKIANLRKALIENVTNYIDASTVAMADLNNQIARINGIVKGLPRSERELVSIQRRFDFNDHVYNYLLEKRAEAGIAIASNTIEKTIVDRAKQVGQGPVFPNSRLILMLAVALSMVLATGFIVVKDVVSENIVTLEDVERNTTIPFIGMISHGNRHDRARTIVAHTRSELGESFRSLRVNLQYLTLGKENNVIGVTSSITNEGKTFCSINLAVATALAGRRTVLIDADMRRPSVASSFRLASREGLSDFLNGKCAVEHIISETPIEGLDVVAAGPVPPNPLDLIGNDRMEDLILHLKDHYNTIIIDTPPVGYVSEYIILMKYTDVNLYVVRSNYTNSNHLDRINRLYKDRKINNVGILLNDAKMPLNGYKNAYP